MAQAERDVAVERLRAMTLEYEHALHHIIECGAACPDCRCLAKSAIEGVNREDFLEQAKEERAGDRRD